MLRGIRSLANSQIITDPEVASTSSKPANGSMARIAANRDLSDPTSKMKLDSSRKQKGADEQEK